MKAAVFCAVSVILLAIIPIGMRMSEDASFHDTFGVDRDNPNARAAVYAHLNFMSYEACTWIAVSNKNPGNKAVATLRSANLDLVWHAVGVAKGAGFKNEHGELGIAEGLAAAYQRSLRDPRHFRFSCG